MNRRPSDGAGGERAERVRVHVLVCVECGSRSGLHARGWRAYRTDEPGTDARPSLAFYCPACAAANFGD